MKTKNVVTFILIAGVVLLLLFIVFKNEMLRLLNEDLFKISYQFILLTVVGGIVSLVLENYSREQNVRRDKQVRQEEKRYKEQIREQERVTVRNKILLSFHDTLVETYNETKKIRRLLRARARRKSPSGDSNIQINMKEYDLLLQGLINAQLKFEFCVRQVKSNESLFGSNPAVLKNLQLIESYLNKIVNEYEDNFANLSSGEDNIVITDFPRLAEFIESRKEGSRFSKSIKASFKTTLASIEELIINPRG